MNREILFRGKSINTDFWIQSMTISKGTIKRKREDVFLEVDEHKWVGVFPESVGQFTGLTDKNGVKIFEGDIVKIEGLEFVAFMDDGTYVPGEKYKDSIVAVYFCDGQFCFDHPNTGTPCPLSYNIDNTEVIGNIYDNPELLSQSKCAI